MFDLGGTGALACADVSTGFAASALKRAARGKSGLFWVAQAPSPVQIGFGWHRRHRLCRF